MKQLSQDILIDNIKQQIHPHSITQKGVFVVACPFCSPNQYKAGFLFDTDSVGYNCFKSHCPIGGARWTIGRPMSKKMKRVFDAFGIKIPIEARKLTSLEELFDPNLYKKPKHVELTNVSGLRPYDPNKDIRYRKYLESRQIDSERFFIGTGYVLKHNMKDMLIVPLYVSGKLIGLQGRDIFRKRYQTVGTDVIYMPNNGYLDYNQPVYVVEGVYDAIVLPNTIATLCDSVTPQQAWLLRHHNPILIPDRNTTNYINIAKKYGWRVSIPGYDAKDVNEAVSKYGHLVVAKMIYDGIIDNPVVAEVRYKLWKSS